MRHAELCRTAAKEEGYGMIGGDASGVAHDEVVHADMSMARAAVRPEYVIRSQRVYLKRYAAAVP